MKSSEYTADANPSGETWECTSALRWYTLGWPSEPTLQQLWVSYSGKQDWRDVPWCIPNAR